MFKNTNKKPIRDVESFIEWWTKLDDFIHLLKNKKAVRYWEKECVPHNYILQKEDGEIIAYPFQTTITTKSGKERDVPLSYASVTINRYWWKDQFKFDSYKRIEAVFRKALKMAMED